MGVQDCLSCRGTGRHGCSSRPGGAGTAKAAPGKRALQGRHRRLRRDPSGSTHTVHFRHVLHELAGALCLAIDAFFLGFPTSGPFIPGYYDDFHAGECVDGAQVIGDKLTIRNELAGHPRHFPALGFTPLAQSLVRHASKRTCPRVPGETAGRLTRSGSLLRFQHVMPRTRGELASGVPCWACPAWFR